MSRPICQCKSDSGIFISMRPKKNGILVRDDVEWPKGFFSVMRADLFECPVCGHLVIHGFGEPQAMTESEMREALRVEDQKEILIRVLNP